jgi:hypothetical protein
MIIAPLAAIALVLGIATGPVTAPTALPPMSMQQRSAAVQPSVRSATECIARTVTADPGFGQRALGDLIADSMRACLAEVRAMIETYDRYFGEGSGESFFMGPYLDVLPSAVGKWRRQSVE